MAILHTEEEWLRACNGNNDALSRAFIWVSTEEGYEFWRDKCSSSEPMSPDIMERIRYLYTEWKILGDTDDRREASG